MKKVLSLLTLVLVICFSSTSLVSAAPSPGFDPLGNPCAAAPDSTLCKESLKPQTQGNNSLFGSNGVITKGTRLIAILVGVASTIMIMVGGLQYILASGDSTNINNAKNTILYAIIGLVVAIVAQAIVVFILGGIT